MNPNEESSNGAHPDHMEIRLGRRKTDVTIILEWAVKRGLVKCNVAYVIGIYLEEIPCRIIPKGTILNTDGRQVPVMEKIQMAMVLVRREWGNKLFFMNERKDWQESDYFEAADLLIQERKKVDENFGKSDE